MRSDDFWSWYDFEAAPNLRMRDSTFRKMFEYLDTFDRPVRITETGCAREPSIAAGWEDGCSTYLFDRYAQTHPGTRVRSVDISAENVEIARGAVSSATSIKCADSVETLESWSSGKKIDLLYLDSFDLDNDNPVPSALHHLKELMAIMPALRPDSLVVVDDAPATITDFLEAKIVGKGELVARYLFSVGADLEFSEYQAGWTNVTAKPSKDSEAISDLIFRAREHVEAGRIVAADHLYRLVLSLTRLPPLSGVSRVARGEACVFFANLARTKESLGTAAEWYFQALKADPAAVDYRLDLVTKCCLPMRLFDLAFKEAKKATEIAPDNRAAWRTLGGIEHVRRELKSAAIAYNRAIEIDRNDPDSALDRATLAIDMADYDLARELSQKGIGTSREADALHILAMVASRVSEHEAAIDLFDRAIEGGCLDPPLAHWNKSLSLEAIGIWPEAWAERAWRAKSRTLPDLGMPMKRFNAPMWDGQPGPGRIHVHGEAGAGDDICFARYLPLIAERGLEVCYEARPEFESLVRSSMPNIEVMRRTPYYPDVVGIKAFDYQIPAGHLQHVFRTTVDTVPWSGPYLKSDPDLIKEYDRRTRQGSRSLLVGLCWSSGVRLTETAWLAEYGKRKSMHFDKMKSVLEVDGSTFVSLQVGPERDQCKGKIIDVLPESPTWADTAALVECLDLVITVDTAVAHLAGAMGKPVWIMTQRDAASWHFMCWRPGAPWNDRSPWYPSARVFRQHRFNEPHYWDEVVADVARELSLWNVAQAAE